LKFGSEGSGNGQFNGPDGIAIDKNDNIYVGDYKNNCIQKFDTNGNYISRWGRYGHDLGEFVTVDGIAVDSTGNIYAADDGNNRIQVFPPQ
jgi:DNA-binding beta-propeller fold protein YncE